LVNEILDLLHISDSPERSAVDRAGHVEPLRGGPMK
jgi:hypothetical protein